MFLYEVTFTRIIIDYAKFMEDILNPNKQHGRSK